MSGGKGLLWLTLSEMRRASPWLVDWSSSCGPTARRFRGCGSSLNVHSWRWKRHSRQGGLPSTISHLDFRRRQGSHGRRDRTFPVLTCSVWTGKKSSGEKDWVGLKSILEASWDASTEEEIVRCHVPSWVICTCSAAIKGACTPSFQISCNCKDIRLAILVEHTAPRLYLKRFAISPVVH
jgi:hypothetical protein